MSPRFRSFRARPRALPVLAALAALGAAALALEADVPAAASEGGAGLAVQAGIPATPPPSPTPAADTLVGYPVESDVVVRNCARCHTVDSAGRMSRISYLRKTPEGWERSVRRMVSLNGVRLDPAAAREIVRYLADRHGIAPEELRPARWEVERRSDDFDYDGPDDVEETCIPCHSIGRVLTERRTGDEWRLLMATHRGYYPLVDFQAFYDRSPDREGPHPVEKAVAHFTEVFPLETAAWSAWSANVRPPRLEGAWALRGHDRARGPFYDSLDVRPVPGAEGEFTTEARYVFPEDGGSVTRDGRAVVYTGYQWRGRSTAGSDPGNELREVMMIERGWSEMSGRWFTGANDELGVDVTLLRAGAAPVVSGVHPPALEAGSRDAEVRIFGHGLSGVDVDFGPGVRVSRIEESTPGLLVVRVDVAADAAKGARDLVLQGALRESALVVHDGVDRIEILPRAGMARVGGEAFPKQYERFEAVGFDDGPDGEPETDDDLPLGRVPVEWSLDEYPVTYDDDDILFVGEIDQTGLFTPAVDGPNPERSGERNNIGDVWVLATHTPESAPDRTLSARAHLLVTVPLYMRWDPWPPPAQTPRSATNRSPNPGDPR
ncbi:MAG: quinohemoprotein amine dehydrogenase subunit alpha [Gemmatimonadetes bacterium]|nr:quinohemoprotein amine dehydrogenase subunit alpha [Gemmatimonadota bacterium]